MFNIFKTPKKENTMENQNVPLPEELEDKQLQLNEINFRIDFLQAKAERETKMMNWGLALTAQQELINLMGPQWRLEYEIKKLKQEQENGSN